MPIIPEQKRKSICDACGKETGAWASEFSESGGEESTMAICHSCKVLGIIWAAKQALKEKSKYASSPEVARGTK